LKKKLFILLSLSVLGFSLYFFSSKAIYRLHKKKCKNTFLNYISKEKFNQSVENIPTWMVKQIDNEFKFFEKAKISQDALDETFFTIQIRRFYEKDNFIRYRIIDNEIFAYLPEEKIFSKRQFTFERALKTLSKITKLPDIDIIYSDEDGTPIFDRPESFYEMIEKDFQAPLLSRAKLKNNNFVILIPDYHDLSHANPMQIKNFLKLNETDLWEKKISKAFWRGTNRRKARYLLAKLSYNNPDIIDAGFLENIYEKNYELDDPAMDVSHLEKPYASIQEHLKYKYQPVLDGFFCTYPGYKWRLLSNSICFKQESDQIQWFYSALNPYEHYIPIKNDMSDVFQKISWAQKNDDKCKKISQNATDFVIDNLQIENVYAYLFHLLKKYETTQAFDKKDLIKDTVNNPRWISIQNRKKAHMILKRKGYNIY